MSTNKPGRLSCIAPLRQWSQYRAMHLGTRHFVQPAPARHERMTHRESGDVDPSVVRTYNISLQRTGIDKVHALNCSGGFWCSVHAPQVRRPASELGRYISESLRTIG
jgi:hypothetical protein